MVMRHNKRWIVKTGILVMGMVALAVYTALVYQSALLRARFSEQIELLKLGKARMKDDKEDEAAIYFKSGFEG
jgi:hypothetical protein